MGLYGLLLCQSKRHSVWRSCTVRMYMLCHCIVSGVQTGCSVQFIVTTDYTTHCNVYSESSNTTVLFTKRVRYSGFQHLCNTVYCSTFAIPRAKHSNHNYSLFTLEHTIMLLSQYMYCTSVHVHALIYTYSMQGCIQTVDKGGGGGKLGFTK